MFENIDPKHEAARLACRNDHDCELDARVGGRMQGETRRWSNARTINMRLAFAVVRNLLPLLHANLDINIKFCKGHTIPPHNNNQRSPET